VKLLRLVRVAKATAPLWRCRVSRGAQLKAKVALVFDMRLAGFAVMVGATNAALAASRQEL
jgi:hypothetical protein